MLTTCRKSKHRYKTETFPNPECGHGLNLFYWTLTDSARCVLVELLIAQGWVDADRCYATGRPRSIA